MQKSAGRRERLTDECLRQAALVGRFVGTDQERRAAEAEYRGQLSAMTDPELEKERGQLELASRRRYTATTENLLRSSGPRVVTKFLGQVGLTVFMRRLDLLELAQSGVFAPEPLTERVLEMIDAETVPDAMFEPKRYSETIMALRAIACAVCVLPPDRYFEDPDFAEDQIDPADCRPQFVMPGAKAADGQLPIWVSDRDVRADGWRGLRKADLKEIAQAVMYSGPGALYSFRIRQDSLVEDRDESRVDGRPAKRAARGRVRVAGD